MERWNVSMSQQNSGPAVFRALCYRLSARLWKSSSRAIFEPKVFLVLLSLFLPFFHTWAFISVPSAGGRRRRRAARDRVLKHFDGVPLPISEELAYFGRFLLCSNWPADCVHHEFVPPAQSIDGLSTIVGDHRLIHHHSGSGSSVLDFVG